MIDLTHIPIIESYTTWLPFEVCHVVNKAAKAQKVSAIMIVEPWTMRHQPADIENIRQEMFPDHVLSPSSFAQVTTNLEYTALIEQLRTLYCNPLDVDRYKQVIGKILWARYYEDAGETYGQDVIDRLVPAGAVDIDALRLTPIS